MARFEDALPTVLRHEGLYSEDPADPGGATNYGISLRFLRQLGDTDGDGFAEGDLDHDHDVDAKDVQAMSVADAAKWYRESFWIPGQIGLISDQRVANKAFDLAVNVGLHQAGILVQRALAAVGQPVKVDGAIGARTLNATNQAHPRELLAALRAETAGYYRSVALARPALMRFLRGWLRRAYE